MHTNSMVGMGMLLALGGCAATDFEDPWSGPADDAAADESTGSDGADDPGVTTGGDGEDGTDDDGSDGGSSGGDEPPPDDSGDSPPPTGEPPAGGDTQEPFPLDMGDAPGTPGTYKGLPLRLVDNGSPQVTPVDGTIGVVCIGMSNATQECSAYISALGHELTGHSAQVEVVDCAVGGHAIEKWADPAFDHSLWSRCMDRVAQAGLQPEQVRVLYHKAANQFTAEADMMTPLPPYPDPGSDYFNFIDNLSALAARVPEKFPSVQAVYTTSRSYGGYAGQAARGEPLSYEEGHALNTWLADNPELGGIWYGWGPYIWAPDCDQEVRNGSDVCYVREDYQDDGVHPAAGALEKISQMIHEHFLQEDWYAQ